MVPTPSRDPAPAHCPLLRQDSLGYLRDPRVRRRLAGSDQPFYREPMARNFQRQAKHYQPCQTKLANSNLRERPMALTRRCRMTRSKPSDSCTPRFTPTTATRSPPDLSERVATG